MKESEEDTKTVMHYGDPTRDGGAVKRFGYDQGAPLGSWDDVFQMLQPSWEQHTHNDMMSIEYATCNLSAAYIH